MECGGNDAALASGDPSEVGSMARPRTIQSAVIPMSIGSALHGAGFARDATSHCPVSIPRAALPNRRGAVRMAGGRDAPTGSTPRRHRRHGKMIMGYGEFTRAAGRPAACVGERRRLHGVPPLPPLISASGARRVFVSRGYATFRFAAGSEEIRQADVVPAGRSR